LIRDKYKLKEVIVVDAADNRDQLLRNLGAGAAHYLENTIKANDVIGISSWSEALLATANTMQRLGSSINVNVIQILGGLGNPTSESHAAQLTRRLAELVNGEAIMLPAPGIVGAADTRTILLQDPYLQDVLKLFDNVTLALVGIGTVEPSRILANSGNAFPGNELDLLRGVNAVGDVCLRFFDVNGKPVETLLNERVIGMSLQQMKQVKRSIGVAGGERKHAAIRAAIRGGWINILVTDYETAKFLAEHE
jgi:DNA-binding transcriptional regulator LsrR (DeoR family)